MEAATVSYLINLQSKMSVLGQYHRDRNYWGIFASSFGWVRSEGLQLIVDLVHNDIYIYTELIKERIAFGSGAQVFAERGLVFESLFVEYKYLSIPLKNVLPKAGCDVY